MQGLEQVGRDVAGAGMDSNKEAVCLLMSRDLRYASSESFSSENILS